MIQITTIIILIVLSAAFNALCDVLTFQFRDSIFMQRVLPYKWQVWLNPQTGAKNMYKHGDVNKGERFTGSTTVFLWLTNGYHFTQFWSITLFEFALCLAVTWSPWAFAMIIGLKLGRAIIHLLTIKLFTTDGQ